MRGPGWNGDGTGVRGWDEDFRLCCVGLEDLRCRVMMSGVGCGEMEWNGMECQIDVDAMEME
jgi:hypothetical protein